MKAREIDIDEVTAAVARATVDATAIASANAAATDALTVDATTMDAVVAAANSRKAKQQGQMKGKNRMTIRLLQGRPLKILTPPSLNDPLNLFCLY